MSRATKQETAEALITVRLPKGLMVRVEEIIANRFSTKSEYIRDLIRRDVMGRQDLVESPNPEPKEAA
jgi:metal-responsive CopG/Arc/MetJ family transcriptional regulator